MQRVLLASLAAAAVFGASFTAAAHTVLTNPTPLTQDDNAKAGPCGCYFGAGPQDPTEDATPLPCPQNFTVTELVAGSEITLSWKETVNHNGSFRFAFSPNPPSQVTSTEMNNNVLMDLPDQNATSGATITQKMTVPSEPCELCTLQLRQFMMGAAQPYYYSCAAVKIVAPDAGTSSSTGTGGTGGAGTGAGNGGMGGAGASGQGASDPGGEGGSTGAGMAQPGPEVPEGCSFSAGGSGSGRAPVMAGLALGVAALLGSIRRRRGGPRPRA
ncbi:MAG: SCE4755 family polysaccharide monooxygenase-like protein [Polyangiaceae bacterium]